jgi:predicted ATPase with chaperone activity
VKEAKGETERKKKGERDRQRDRGEDTEWVRPRVTKRHRSDRGRWERHRGRVGRG